MSPQVSFFPLSLVAGKMGTPKKPQDDVHAGTDELGVRLCNATVDGSTIGRTNLRRWSPATALPLAAVADCRNYAFMVGKPRASSGWFSTGAAGLAPNTIVGMGQFEWTWTDGFCSCPQSGLQSNVTNAASTKQDLGADRSSSAPCRTSAATAIKPRSTGTQRTTWTN
jgi:hypothetical protein